MILCGWVQKNILLFLENQLSHDVSERVRLHILKCSHCAAVAEQVEEVRLPVKAAVQSNQLPSDEFVSNVMAQIDAMPDPQTCPNHIEIPRFAWVLSGILLLMVIVYVIGALTGHL